MMESEAVRGGTDTVLRPGCLLLEKVKYRETSWWRKKQVYSECRPRPKAISQLLEQAEGFTGTQEEQRKGGISQAGLRADIASWGLVCLKRILFLDSGLGHCGLGLCVTSKSCKKL